MFLKALKILCIICALSIISNPARAENRLVFSTAENVRMGKAAENILKQAYKSIGIDVRIVEYPALRAIISANQGEVDGELIRVKGIDATYTDLIMIPVPLAAMEGVVFTKNADFEVAGFESLRPYKITFRRGVNFAENGTKGMNRVILDSLEQAFLLLHRERVDVVITPRLTGLDTLSKLPFKEIKILEPPLIQTSFYHYLNKKHEALVPKITAVFQEMHDDGRIAKENERLTNMLLESIKPNRNQEIR